MKTDDIFEALTDIDDRFIEAARPLEQIEPGQPMIVTPAPRKPRWKTVVPAAACLAAVVTAGAVGGRYLYTKSHSAASNLSSESIAFWYPDEAKYRVNGDILLNCSTCTKEFNGLTNKFFMEETYVESYTELAAQSDLIIAGEFVDAPHQIQDPDKIHSDQSISFLTEEYSEEGSYNYLSVERVLKGDIEEGNIVLIRQEASLHENGGGAYILFANDLLSPMIKGDKWIYFLKKSENGFYTPVNGPQGRYPMPGNSNTGVRLEDDVKDTIDDFGALKCGPAANRAEIYEELLKLIDSGVAEIPKIEQIGVQDDARSFAMPEFPDYDFKVSRAMVWADYFGEYGDIMDVFVFKAPDGGRLENLMLADLTGDGKRELCATISENGVRSVVVRDFENGVTYTMPGGKAQEYALEVKDDALNVITIIHESIDLVISSSQPLTLDMMITDNPDKQLTEIALDNERWFTLPDFEGFKFFVGTSHKYPEFKFNWKNDSAGSANSVNAIYLCDLDGDGKREIILNCPFVDDGCIRVYGFMENGELGEALYFENGGCQLAESDGILKYKAKNSGERPFDFSRSDLKPIFAQNYSYELLDWDHFMSYKEIVPISGAYKIEIKDRTLKINHKGELQFDSGHKLSELYTIPDKENNSLVFVFTNASDGTVGALKISEQPAMLHRFEEPITLKPTTEELLIVHADGTEEPFRFPEVIGVQFN